MYSLAFLMGLSALAAWLLTPAIRNLCRAQGWLDQPDHRKQHTQAVPRLGGLAIMLAYGLSLLVFAMLPLAVSLETRPHWSQILRLLPGVSLVLFMGLVDDLRGLRPFTKIVAEVAAALTAYSAGVRIGGDEWWALPLTVLWLVGTTNAVNLIDGVDGLAAGVSLFATLTMFAAAMIHGNMLLAIVTAPLAGCLIGFLRYNFEPASIFLGDSGKPDDWLPAGLLWLDLGLQVGYRDWHGGTDDVAYLAVPRCRPRHRATLPQHAADLRCRPRPHPPSVTGARPASAPCGPHLLSGLRGGGAGIALGE